MNSKPTQFSHIQMTIEAAYYTRLLRLYFLLAAFEGLGAFVYLLLLPSDAGGRWLGFSGARWAMLSAAMLGALAFAALYLTGQRWGWFVRLSGALFGRREFIPNLLLGLLSSAFLLSGWLLIFQTQLLLQLNEAYLARLAAFMIWGLLLVFQLGGIWIWLWRRPRFNISIFNLDISLLLAIWLISLVSRVLLTGYGLPYQSVWDEVVTYPQALNLFTTSGLHPYADVPGYGRTAYGDLLVYFTAGSELLGLMEGFRSQEVSSVQAFVSPPRGVATIYQAVHESGIPLRFPRLAFALINSLMPLMLYLILRRFFAIDPWSSTGAALILGFFSRDFLYYSSYILPDALAVTLFVCVLFTAWRAMDSPVERWVPWLVAGLLGGMIIGVNIRMVVAAGLPFLALVFCWRSGNQATGAQNFVRRFVAIIAGLMLGFVFTSPYALLDLPNFLAKWTSFSWYHILDWKHRIESIAFYLQGMFMPGFSDVYIDSSSGSIGMGLPAGVLAAIGLTGLIKRQPRKMLVVLLFAVLQLYMISPIVQRFTRHALTLYPVVALSVGMGLVMLAQAAKVVWKRLVTHPSVRWAWVEKALPVLVLVLFLLLYAGQIRLVSRYIQRITSYQPSQVRAAVFLENTLQPGEKVGILDLIPWVESDLERRGIEFVRVGLNDSPEQWVGQNLTYVVGTDRLQDDYGSAAGTIWAGALATPGARLAEFGNTWLKFAGYPSNELYLFVARVPGATPRVQP